ncbi:SPOR domain-containing protein [Salinisphaera orenii]|uniref:SPOR domain-containing protein n=1 Tax=Salinisphaera orenii YIM 95161 TaxID=1051139 RepID=A0A423PEF2_9GAMM|nr:SPOR domain-containing protein [Salinisphaera halophila]ROO23950.1 hypothetical protein SAHL_16380 [Salinisphaera halophila YIM 95161]
MQDVMKKRIVGAVVLVIIGVLIPLLLARCLNGGDGATQSMRVYEITPEGEARRAGEGEGQQADAADEARGAGGDATGDGSGDAQSAPPPEPVSPESDADATAAGEAEPDEPQPESTPTPELPPEPAADTQTASAPDGPSDAAPEAEADSEPEPPQAGAADAESTASEGGALRRDSAPAGGGWVVQVASFRQESNAQGVADALSGDFDAYYRAGDVDGTTYYRVRIGPFESEDAARAAASTLRSQGRSALVQRNR